MHRKKRGTTETPVAAYFDTNTTQKKAINYVSI